MLYVTRRLHISEKEVIGPCVVNIVEGKCISFFSFERELQSMIIIDDVVLCNMNFCEFAIDSIEKVFQSGRLDENADMYAYSLNRGEVLIHLRRLL